MHPQDTYPIKDTYQNKTKANRKRNDHTLDRTLEAFRSLSSSAKTLRQGTPVFPVTVSFPRNKTRPQNRNPGSRLLFQADVRQRSKTVSIYYGSYADAKSSRVLVLIARSSLQNLSKRSCSSPGSSLRPGKCRT